ncbi:hypothetical protein [Paenibacillus sp. Marseille-P2973]|nr:hypothetical protein [Paenibacillus sp. Marseille-P2973]
MSVRIGSCCYIAPEIAEIEVASAAGQLSRRAKVVKQTAQLA